MPTPDNPVACPPCMAMDWNPDDEYDLDDDGTYVITID